MESIKRFRLSRRTFLRGTGVAIALPYLEAMMPSSVMAAPAPVIPPRMGMFYFGTGMNMRQFDPVDEGRDFTLSRILQPLAAHRGDFTVLSGTFLEHGGGHDGAYPFATAIARGNKQHISPDQMVAKVQGRETRFPSLIMSVDEGTNFGSQALATIAWNEQGVPLAAENDPKAIFDRLFRPDTAAQKARSQQDFEQRGSVLDLVLDDARSMQASLGQADRQQLDQYFNSIRELETALRRKIEWADRPKPKVESEASHDYSQSMTPAGNGKFFYDDYAKMMYDLIALAFQSDSTRVASYVVRKELAGGVYPEFNVSKGYHALTHHGNDPQNLEELAKVDTIYMSHWAYFLDRLKSVKQGDGTLLDHTVLGFSSGMGFEHSKDHLPTVVSGGRALGVEHQGHLRLAEPTPLASVWHTLVDRTGTPVEGEFQDSAGPIRQLIKA